MLSRSSASTVEPGRAAALGERAMELAPLAGRRVVVTGASGFIGSAVASLGQLAGVDVVALGRRDPGIPGVSHIAADLVDGQRVREAIARERPDGLLHLAAAGVGPGAGPEDLLRTNVIGLANLLAAMRDAGVGAPTVLAGSGYEYGSYDRPVSEDDPLAPISPYGVAKAAATLWAGLHASEQPITVLRLFNVYGPGEREPRLLPAIVAASREGRAVDLTPCDQIRDFVYVDDAAECFWRALMEPGEAGAVRVLNVGTGSPIVLRDLIEIAAGALRARGLSPDLRIGARPHRPGEPMHYTADIARLRATLGWLPGTPLVDGVTRTVEAML